MRLLAASAVVLASITLSAQTATNTDSAAARRRRAAGRRGENGVRARDEGHQAGHRARPSNARRLGHRALHRLEDRRHDVRQLGGARQAVELPRRPRDRRLQRRAAADGRRREAPAVDSRVARLQGAGGKARGDAGLRRRVDRHAQPPAGRREGAAQRREAHAERPRLQSAERRRRRTPPETEQHRHGELHRLDDRREDVRQLGRARPAGDVSARRRDPRMDRRAAVDGRRREDALLDSREPRLQRKERAVRDARVRRGADRDQKWDRAGRKGGRPRFQPCLPAPVQPLR